MLPRVLPQMDQVQDAAESTEQDYRQLRAQLDQLADAKWKLEAREAEVRARLGFDPNQTPN